MESIIQTGQGEKRSLIKVLRGFSGTINCGVEAMYSNLTLNRVKFLISFKIPLPILKLALNYRVIPLTFQHQQSHILFPSFKNDG